MAKERSEWQKHWAAVVAEQEASGKSVFAFRREGELPEPTSYWWGRRLHEKKTVSFALVEAKAVVRPAKVELTLSRGEVLHVPAEVESLRVVFEALRSAQ